MEEEEERRQSLVIVEGPVEQVCFEFGVARKGR